jgi:hypothetical protein
MQSSNKEKTYSPRIFATKKIKKNEQTYPTQTENQVAQFITN